MIGEEVQIRHQRRLDNLLKEAFGPRRESIGQVVGGSRPLSIYRICPKMDCDYVSLVFQK